MLEWPARLVFHVRMKLLKAVGLVLVCLAVCPFTARPAPAADLRAPATASLFLVYIGTYSGAKSKGIHVCRLDAATGQLTTPELAAEAVNPTFLAIHPSRPLLFSADRAFLYAANEISGRGTGGAVSAFVINKETGRLTLLNQQSSQGSGPCHLSLDATGKWVLVANYNSGSVAVLPVKDDGSLGEATAAIQHAGSGIDKKRQDGPHAHWINVSADNRFAFACDLGLDKVMIYKFDPAKGSLAANDPAFAALKAGSGPRHLAFDPNGRFAYLISEIGQTMTAFTYDAARGALQEIQTLSTLPEGFSGQNTTAEVEVHPSGKFLYGSNRGHDSIVVYAIDEATGKLTFVEHQSTQGKGPRNFAIDPTGQWLFAANQGTDNIVTFRVDPKTGRLTPTGQTVHVGAPVCLKFLPLK